jgi:hypothetical protein
MTDIHIYTPSSDGLGISKSASIPNTSVYIVYVEATENHAGGIYHTTCDLNEARTIAQGYAKDYPGCQIHIATRISTFRAETVVKEV